MADDKRDYGAEVREVVDRYCSGRWSAPQVAVTVVDYLRNHDPELLAGFLDLQAVNIVRDMINSSDRSSRTYNRTLASRSVFRHAADQFEQTGDETPLRTHFLMEDYVVADGTKSLLKDMRADDLSYVASNLNRQAKTLNMRAAFLGALAKRCKDNLTVGQVFNEEDLVAMWTSLTRTTTSAISS